MRRRFVVFSAVLLLLVNLFCVTGTYAWFTSAGNVGDGEFDSGIVHYEPGGDFVNTAYTTDPVTGSQTPTKELVVPGSTLVNPENPLTLANQSTVNTKLKIEISYEFRLRPGEEDTSSDGLSGTSSSPSYAEKMEDLFTFELDTAAWKLTKSTSELDKEDRKRIYYYGESGTDAEDDQGQAIPPDQLTAPFHVISSMKLADYYGGFRLEEQLLITVRFYARQSEFLDGWSKIADYTIGI